MQKIIMTQEILDEYADRWKNRRRYKPAGCTAASAQTYAAEKQKASNPGKPGTKSRIKTATSATTISGA
jgi:hypothetical protein